MPRSSQSKASDTSPSARRRGASPDGAGPAKKSGKGGKGRGKKGKRKKKKGSTTIRVFLNGHPRVNYRDVDVATLLDLGENSIKVSFERLFMNALLFVD